MCFTLLAPCNRCTCSFEGEYTVQGVQQSYEEGGIGWASSSRNSFLHTAEAVSVSGNLDIG